MGCRRRSLRLTCIEGGSCSSRFHSGLVCTHPGRRTGHPTCTRECLCSSLPRTGRWCTGYRRCTGRRRCIRGCGCSNCRRSDPSYRGPCRRNQRRFRRRRPRGTHSPRRSIGLVGTQAAGLRSFRLGTYPGRCKTARRRTGFQIPQADAGIGHSYRRIRPFGTRSHRRRTVRLAVS
jgi:hypothetical protein